ncbi:hypothetical protein GCM10007924_26370 [Sneathiella chinensis]|uniref:histidine kinase n=1 Tax=Sneathiella chinensis TaxID=349750 RepID=A0ABQ5U7M7_9PROT|nr:hypothetical protein GCM10007924_26370 [Sneathiella chinensis]
MHSGVKSGAAAAIPALQGIVSRDFFDAIFEQSHPMYVARPDGTVIYANNGYASLFGTGRSQRTGSQILPALRSDHRDIVTRIARTRDVETRQVSVETARGTEYYLSRHFPIHDQNDGFIAICGSFINSTRQVNAESKLRLEKRRFLDITRAASDWIWETDVNGNITFISDRVVQAVGQPPLLLRGRALTDLGTFRKEGSGSSKAETAMENHVPFRSVPMTIESIDGETKVYNLSGVPVFNEKGRFVGYRGTSDDITARLAAENEASSSRADLEKAVREISHKNLQLEMTAKKAVAAARAKDEFLATMSHELRTPLNAIIGFAEVMGLETFGPLSEKYQEYVTDILNSGRHLLSLIEDILDIARIESDKIPLELEPTSLRNLVDDARILVQKKATDKGLDLSAVRIDDDIALHVDPTRSLQIIVNLLGNAVKFTPEGGKIGADTEIRDGNMLALTIWDTGPGIEESDQERIFEAFKQAHNGIYSRGEDGVGLGLTLSLKLARLMGGNITVACEPGQGSRFTVTLPLMP